MRCLAENAGTTTHASRSHPAMETIILFGLITASNAWNFISSSIQKMLFFFSILLSTYTFLGIFSPVSQSLPSILLPLQHHPYYSIRILLLLLVAKPPGITSSQPLTHDASCWGMNLLHNQSLLCGKWNYLIMGTREVHVVSSNHMNQFPIKPKRGTKKKEPRERVLPKEKRGK